MNTRSNELQNAAVEDYLLNKGAKRNPFFMENFFFSGAERNEMLELLQHLCHFGESFLVVEGIEGVGKTSLLDKFVEEIDGDVDSLIVNCEVLMGQAQLETAVEQFIKSKIPLKDSSLDLYLDHLKNSSKIFVLLVDEAHYLGEEAFDYLVDLVSRYADTTFHIVMFAEPQISELLDRKTTIARLGQSLHKLKLEAFNRSETEFYIDERFRFSGIPVEQKFLSVSDFNQLHNISEGIPGKIDVEAQFLISILAEDAENRIKLPLAHIVAIGVLVLVMGASYFFNFDGGSNSESSREAIENISALEQSNLDQEESNIAVDTLEQEVIDSLDKNLDPLGDSVELDVISQIESSNAMLDEQSLAEVFSGAEKQEFSDIDVQIEKAERELAEDREVSSTNIEDLSGLEPIELVVKMEGNQLVELGVEVADHVAVGNMSGSSDLSIESEIATDQKAVSEVQSLNANLDEKPVNPHSVEEVAYSLSEREILALNSGSYTLQLMGSYREDAIIKLVGSKPLAPLYYYRSQFQNKNWFVLIMGEYKSKNAAVSGISKVSEYFPTANFKPWVRSIASIQDDLKGR